MASPQGLQDELDQHRARVDVDAYDITVRELVRMAAARELRIDPEYQRQFRWKHEDESRLIESVFLGLPVPSLFVATNPDGSWEVVDGLQRLATLLHFVETSEEALGVIGMERPLRLKGLEKLTSFNGLAFAELPAPIQLLFQKRGLRVTALSDKSDPEVRFEVFDRLNRGGVILTPQEVRHCVFRGRLIQLLKELAQDAEFVRLTKLQRGHQGDGTREELVLKFFAYRERREEFDGRVTDFLNDFARQHQQAPDADQRRDLFSRTVGAVAGVVTGPIMRSSTKTTPLALAEAILVAAADELETGGALQPSTGWMDDEELTSASTKGTNTRQYLRRRIDRARALLQGDEPKLAGPKRSRRAASRRAS